MIDRFYAFFGAHGCAVAMHVTPMNDTDSDGRVVDSYSILTVALALCTNKDRFDKKTARNILDGRLEHHLNGRPTDWVFSVNYKGAFPKRDVMCRVMDTLRMFLPGLNRKRSYENVKMVKREVTRILQQIDYRDLEVGADGFVNACFQRASRDAAAAAERPVG